jgi:methionine-rich copper-binding protein CopC
MRRIAFLAALGVLFTSSAFAHTHLAKSVPANGSVVTTAPEKITLQFEHEVRLTELTIQQGEAKAERLLVPLPHEPVKEVTAAPPKLAAGAYVVNWRAVGADGHVMSGKVRFTVSADGAAPANAKSGDPAAKH